MKKLICFILVIAIILTIVIGAIFFVNCWRSSEEENYIPLKVIDTVEDKYGNILQQIYYNKETDEYIQKEYSYIFQYNKWICTDQKTTIYKNELNTQKYDKINPTLSIYYNNDLYSNPITIMDNEYVKISIVKYLARDDWYEFGYELKIVNKTNQVLTMSLEDFYIMDILCKPVFSIEHIDAGKTVYFKMAWDKATLTRCHIPYIDNVEFIVKVFDNNNWTDPALAGKRLMIKK